MTELETTLLNALDALQTQYDKKQKIWEKEQSTLWAMFNVTQQSNAALREEVEHLSEQVNSLSKLLSQSGII